MTTHRDSNAVKDLYRGSGLATYIDPDNQIISLLKYDIASLTNASIEAFTRKANHKRENVLARNMLACVLRLFTNMSLSEIGMQIGDKDHATVLHAICKTANNFELYAETRQIYTRVIDKCEKTIYEYKKRKDWEQEQKDRSFIADIESGAIIKTTPLKINGYSQHQKIQELHSQIRQLQTSYFVALKEKDVEITRLKNEVEDWKRMVNLYKRKYENSCIQDQFMSNSYLQSRK